MESSKVLGDSSGKKYSDTTESGWTMYIGSDSIFNDKKDHITHQQDIEEESDDSMASDASSGPIDHNLNPSETKEELAIEVFCGLKSSTGKLEHKQCKVKETNKKIRGDCERRRVRRLSDKRFLDHNNNNNIIIINNNNSDYQQQQQNVPEADSCESQV